MCQNKASFSLFVEKMDKIIIQVLQVDKWDSKRAYCFLKKLLESNFERSLEKYHDNCWILLYILWL